MFFFFNDTATTEIYTLSLHDALPIFLCFSGGFRDTLHWKTVLPNASSTRCSSRFSQSEYVRSEEHTSELQSPDHLVCRLLLEKKKRISPLSALHTSHLTPH